MTAVLVLAAVIADRLLGELPRWHPLVGFGRFVQDVERQLWCDSRIAGVVSLLVAVGPFVAAGVLLENLPGAWGASILVLYLAIGGRSLEDHARAVHDALAADDLPAARERVGRMVSRNTAELDGTAVAAATVESVLENGSDAVFGALFWFAVAGLPGVVLFRLVNTLDAMWGYRNDRYARFGWAAARLDDVLGFVPARLTALTYALLGNTTRAGRCWRTQGPRWKSPNAGPVMAAGAGVLSVRLGGPATYHGVMQDRPVLGEGEPPSAADILRAVRLVNRGTVLWVAVLILLGGGMAVLSDG